MAEQKCSECKHWNRNKARKEYPKSEIGVCEKYSYPGGRFHTWDIADEGCSAFQQKGGQLLPVMKRNNFPCPVIAGKMQKCILVELAELVIKHTRGGE